ncbi:energy-coupling factor transporter ATPase [Caldifermentibacillus hisashii]|uniref:ABC transporter ATP-binding protein n=1 Tax=Caldifermentibacillus hisashii TaxID=996558 RepID=UPI002E1D2EFC|nr:energy-coupling factor transporter ATPase [Caldifermentibacillus hisashii]MED3644915.1 energy-coupling factor transporter ATPase [Caldifermentibacillus hisashii]
MAILETVKVSFTYPDQLLPALNQVSFSVEPGEFIVICGPSGSGKSTLLRMVKQEIAPYGERSGEIFYNGKKLTEYEPVKIAKEIGMVFQDPENQIVMDRVFEELIFGLENIGMPTETMRTKLAEMVHFFGINHLLDKKIHLLSGGQKQIVNLASVLLMEPRILLLDEPTAQLDPVAAKDFLHMVKQMNDEFGITVLIVEHRLEEVFPLADRVFVFDHGSLKISGPPKDVIAKVWQEQYRPLFPYLPSTALLYLEHADNLQIADIPLTVKEGRKWASQLKTHQSDTSFKKQENYNEKQNPILQVKNIYFQYEKTGKKILQSLSLTINEGEWLTIVGANGTGKSTLLKVMAGLESPQRGKLIYNGKKYSKPISTDIAYLPQNPKLLFIQDTVRGELIETAQQFHLENYEEKINFLVELLGIQSILDRHPYDVSGGEMQKSALACVLLPQPKILLLDEPTKGLDPEMKVALGKWLKSMQSRGLTIVMVTHDIEFAARFSDRSAMMFQGEITVTTSTKDFFKGNAFYTTVVNRMTRDGNIPEVVTVEEAEEKWGSQKIKN